MKVLVMKKKTFARLFALLLAFGLVTGCAGGGSNVSGAQTPTGKPLPTPIVNVTAAPKPDGTLRGYLEAWKADDYASMYTLLTPESQQAISLEEFDKKYRAAMNALTLAQLNYEILSVEAISPLRRAGDRSACATRPTCSAAFEREMQISFRLVIDLWRVEWNDGLIPARTGGRQPPFDGLPDPHARRHLRPPAARRAGKRPFVAQTQALRPSACADQHPAGAGPTLLSELGILPALPDSGAANLRQPARCILVHPSRRSASQR